MLDISSSEELVSSSEAACSLAPSASDWLAEETWPAAPAVCSAPAERVSATSRMGPVMERVMETAKPIPSKVATIRPTIIVVEAVVRELVAVPALLADASMLPVEVFLASARTASAAIPRFLPSSSRASQWPRKLVMASL